MTVSLVIYFFSHLSHSNPPASKNLTPTPLPSKNLTPTPLPSKNLTPTPLPRERGFLECMLPPLPPGEGDKRG